MLRVLVACEESATVREAFRAMGHDAWSCDLKPTRIPGNHYQGSIVDFLEQYPNWDLMIAHPPCTDLAVSGARHFPAKIADGRQQKALDFVQYLMDAPIDRICIENPVSVISTKIRRPNQIIQPCQFGHPTTKTTCLWLKNLPKLQPTEIVAPEFVVLSNGKRSSKWMHETRRNGHDRSVTFTGIANAMAQQWGIL
jgi:site-specific DNA-cytosine methylase